MQPLSRPATVVPSGRLPGGGPHTVRSRSARSCRALLLAATLLGGCDSGSSPTEPQSAPPPPPTSSGASIVIVDPDGAFAPLHTEIRAVLDDAHRAADARIPVGLVTFMVTADIARSIPGWGLGGYAPGPSTVEIVVDPEYPGLANVLDERLFYIALHEMHHTVRWRGPGYGSTLHETMISEGLADHFAVEGTGGPLPPWCVAFPESDTDRILALAAPELDSATFDFDAWFFRGRIDLPPWTGYTLGYRLVESRLAANAGATAASLVHAPAGDFPRG